MSAVAAERHTAPARERAPRWPRSRAAIIVRALLQRIMLFPFVRLVCRPIRIERNPSVRVEEGPFVFVANHTSHADTALILRALPPSLRRRTAPAAAEDYFFHGRVRGALVSLLVGAFPFPRRGRAGLDRAAGLLEKGWSVVLFPEGTRSAGAGIGVFKPGAALLASRGHRVVPIGIAGANDVLPKGCAIPRRRAVSIIIGAPSSLDPSFPPPAAAERIRRRVSHLHAGARLLRPAPREAWFDRVRGLARSRTGPAVAFCWGVAEAVFAPVVPDVAVALPAMAAPSRFLVLALAATAGSVAGGAVAYGLGATGAGDWLLAHAPLVTDRMRGHALTTMQQHGAGPLLGQPWTGVPFKVFGYQATDAGVGFSSYLSASLAGRGFRIAMVGAAFASAAAPFVRWREGWARRFYGAVAVSFCVVFVVGLQKVVASWS